MSYILYYNLQLACVWKLENLTRCTRIAASIALNDESYVGIELLWQLKRSAQQEIKKVLRFETADTFDDQQHYRHCLQMKSLSGNASKLLHNVTNFVLCTSPGAILLNAIKVKYGQYFQKYQIHLLSTVLPLILYPLIMKLTCSSHLEPHLHPPGPFCLPSDCRFLKSLRRSEVRYLVYRRSNLPVTSMLRSTICIPAT